MSPSGVGRSRPAVQQPASGSGDLVFLGQRGQLEVLGVGHWSLGATDALDRCIELVEAGAVQARGDLGASYTYSTPVAELVADRIVVSLPLAVLALALTTALVAA